MKTRAINGQDVRQYGLGGLLLFTFAPAIVVMFARGGAIVLEPLGGGIAISAFFALEAVILSVFLYAFSKREGAFSWRGAIPYQARLSPVLFVFLLLGATAYAIYFRDFFRWRPLMEAAGHLQNALAFWPPDWLRGPPFGVTYDDATPLATKLGLLTFGMVAVGAASFMQTLYFRGFLLPRMEYLGWAAPFANTALFVAFHLHSPPFWHLFFIFTLMWGVVAYAFRNVWVAVISHVIFNTYSYVLIMGQEIAAAGR
ncbi:MAG: hypothetical protein Tsb0010_03910 [Parvularculaceae bacterium]